MTQITPAQQQAIRNKKPRVYAEASFQAKCIFWAHNERPETEDHIWAINNNSKNKREGAKNKALGVIAGVSDLQMFWKNQLYCLEMKTVTGSLSKAQKKWRAKMESHGAIYYKINEDFELFKSIIDKILST